MLNMPLANAPPPSPGQLEELEVLMKEDIQDEVGSWGGRILLHQVCEAVPIG